MRKIFSIVLFLPSILGLYSQEAVQPPVARVKPTSVTLHGDTLTDNYAWMKNKNSGAMKKHLKAENNYTDAMMADTKELQEKLYKELLARVKETDMTVPYKDNGYWYYERTTEGQNYPVYCRKKETLDNPEETLLDVNEVVKAEKCYGAEIMEISPGNNIMCYAIDKTGNQVLTAYFKDLQSGKKLADELKRVTSIAWAEDNKTIFYTVEEESTNRVYRLYRHILGSAPETDVLLYEEKDKIYDFMAVSKSKSKNYIYLVSESADETEVRYLPSTAPLDNFKLLYPREKKHKYLVQDYGNKFYITTNKDAINFKVVQVDIRNPAMENWQELIPHREDVALDDIEIFKDYLVISERSGGYDKIRIRRWDTGEEYYLPFEEATYWLAAGNNRDFDTELFRFIFSSLKTPFSAYEINLSTKEKKLLKQWEIPSGHNPDDYVTEKIWATAGDGKKVPISLLYKKGLVKDGSNPVYMQGYGAYGYRADAYFNNNIYPLVERGFIYALAHTRGGDDLGQQWYYDGKMQNKKNTFSDFIACTELLIQENYTSAGLLVAQGASAGGLLMGAVANMRPELYKGIIFHVPFVDALNTMLDTLLPLTTGEFIEWGNPYQKEAYDYIKSYSPYENVKPMDYPNLLFMAGVTDEQVGIWEPAKMVAKLRATKTDNNLLLFKVTFKGGHRGPSGRYNYYKELAFEYSWVLKMFGMKE